jgi:hypothetical protein
MYAVLTDDAIKDRMMPEDSMQTCLASHEPRVSPISLIYVPW